MFSHVTLLCWAPIMSLKTGAGRHWLQISHIHRESYTEIILTVIMKLKRTSSYRQLCTARTDNGAYALVV